MDNKNKLKQIIHKLEKDVRVLPLAKKSSDIVPPEGNPNAEIMFIGEAAGYHEHIKRRPFVGAAGKLLEKSLEEIGIKREQVWISNVLKVRPPQNRDPLPEEIEAYKPFLDAEIRIIKPKIIVPLGRFSMRKFLPKTFISRAHGNALWIDWKDQRILIFPMYHPAAALRNSTVLEEFKQDFIKLSNIIKTLNNQSETAKETVASDQKDSQDQQLSLI